MSENNCTGCKSFDIRPDPHGQGILFCHTCGSVLQSSAIVSEYVCDDVCNNWLNDTTESTKDYLVETKKSQELQSGTNHQTQDQVALDKLRYAEIIDHTKILNLGAISSQTILVDSNSHKYNAVQKTQPIHENDKH